jgi:hypothetical protein
MSGGGLGWAGLKVESWRGDFGGGKKKLEFWSLVMVMLFVDQMLNYLRCSRLFSSTREGQRNKAQKGKTLHKKKSPTNAQTTVLHIMFSCCAQLRPAWLRYYTHEQENPSLCPLSSAPIQQGKKHNQSSCKPYLAHLIRIPSCASLASSEHRTCSVTPYTCFRVEALHSR